MRPVWSGAIAFGLVTIPVKLYAVVESSQEVAFHLLDRTTLTPIKEIRVNPKTDKEVPWDRIVRGVEYAKGRYLPLTREELAALPLPSAHTIDMVGFVDAADVDPLFFEKAYYLRPGDGGEKPYELLRDELEKSGKAGLGKIAMRTREHLALVRPHGRLLLLHTLYFADEVRDMSAVPGAPRHVRVQPAERRMAEQLIASMETSFEPDRYQSEYKTALRKLITAKRAEKPLPEAPRAARIVDLQDALRKSLAQSRHRRPSRRHAKAAG